LQNNCSNLLVFSRVFTFDIILVVESLGLKSVAFPPLGNMATEMAHETCSPVVSTMVDTALNSAFGVKLEKVVFVDAYPDVAKLFVASLESMKLFE